jgi:hypothetical protein
VAEAFADDFGVDAGFEGESGPGVAEAVDWEVWEAVLLDGSFEGLVDTLGVIRRTVWLTEHEVLIDEARADE